MTNTTLYPTYAERLREAYSFLLDNPLVTLKEDSEPVTDDFRGNWYTLRGFTRTGWYWARNREFFDILASLEFEGVPFEALPTDWRDLKPGDDVLVARQHNHTVEYRTVKGVWGAVGECFVTFETGAAADWHEVFHININL